MTAPSPQEDPVPSGSAPPDLDAVRRSDALLDALAERGTAICDPADPVLGLLGSLVQDVDHDQDIPVQPAPKHGKRRRNGPRTIVALGVSSVVLATTGVAAAGGFDSFSGSSATPGPATSGTGQAQDGVGGRTPARKLKQGESLRDQPHPGRPAARGIGAPAGAPAGGTTGKPTTTPSPSQVVIPVVVPSASPSPSPSPSMSDEGISPPLSFGPGTGSPSPSPTATPSSRPTGGASSGVADIPK